MVVNIKISVVWDVIPCSLVPESGGNRFFRNVSIFGSVNIASGTYVVLTVASHKLYTV
jgi:hypothetical protein